jgi:hypothetical protein
MNMETVYDIIGGASIVLMPVLLLLVSELF